MAGSMIDLQPLISRPKSDSSPLEAQLLDVFDAALNAHSPSEQTAEKTAAKLDAQYPAGKGPDKAEDYLWTLWSFFLDVVRKVPSGDARLQLLVGVVQKLKAKHNETVELWGNDTKVWADLPMFGPCMREAWNTRPSFNGTGQDASSVTSWLSLNTFAARVLGAELQLWDNLAVWELRAALEEDESLSDSARKAQLATACEWIIHAGKYLFEKGHKGEKLDESDRRSLQTGKLLADAEPGFSDARWKFWHERLVELGKGIDNDGLKQKVDKATKLMKSLEG
jgi:hypothetical protein